jgi:hypothetical protein
MALQLVESGLGVSGEDMPKRAKKSAGTPSEQQLRYLKRGLDQPGGKLPLFDEYGREIADTTIRSCIDRGWAEPWFGNPIKPYWLVCKLTDDGRRILKNN